MRHRMFKEKELSFLFGQLFLMGSVWMICSKIGMSDGESAITGGLFAAGMYLLLKAFHHKDSN
jgi:hypothetical protein